MSCGCELTGSATRRSLNGFEPLRVSCTLDRCARKSVSMINKPCGCSPAGECPAKLHRPCLGHFTHLISKVSRPFTVMNLSIECPELAVDDDETPHEAQACEKLVHSIHLLPSSASPSTECARLVSVMPMTLRRRSYHPFPSRPCTTACYKEGI